MNRKDVTFRPWADADGNRWECFVHDGFFSYSGYGKTQEEAWRAADSPDLNDADCLTGCAGVITGPTSRAYLGSYFDEGKLSNVVSYGCAAIRWPLGVEVTELVDGGAYFATPGDFSKVDFSACRELGESVNFDATQNQLPPKSGQVTCNIHSTIGVDIGEEAGKRVAAAISRRLSEGAAYYGSPRITATKKGELPRIDFEVEGDDNGKVQAVTRVWVNGQLQPMSSKADTKPKTAQHSEQAKPVLPSLMTEAGERYRGLGWCDE